MHFVKSKKYQVGIIFVSVPNHIKYTLQSILIPIIYKKKTFEQNCQTANTVTQVIYNIRYYFSAYYMYLLLSSRNFLKKGYVIDILIYSNTLFE